MIHFHSSSSSMRSFRQASHLVTYRLQAGVFGRFRPGKRRTKRTRSPKRTKRQRRRERKRRRASAVILGWRYLWCSFQLTTGMKQRLKGEEKEKEKGRRSHRSHARICLQSVWQVWRCRRWFWHCTGRADASSLFSELGTNSRAPLRTCAMIINYPNMGFIHIHAHLGRWMEMVIPTSKRNHDGSYVYK